MKNGDRYHFWRGAARGLRGHGPRPTTRSSAADEWFPRLGLSGGPSGTKQAPLIHRRKMQRMPESPGIWTEKELGEYEKWKRKHGLD